VAGEPRWRLFATSGEPVEFTPGEKDILAAMDFATVLKLMRTGRPVYLLSEDERGIQKSTATIEMLRRENLSREEASTLLRTADERRLKWLAEALFKWCLVDMKARNLSAEVVVSEICQPEGKPRGLWQWFVRLWRSRSSAHGSPSHEGTYDRDFRELLQLAFDITYGPAADRERVKELVVDQYRALR